MRGIHKLGRLVSSGRQIGALNHADAAVEIKEPPGAMLRYDGRLATTG